MAAFAKPSQLHAQRDHPILPSTSTSTSTSSNFKLKTFTFSHNLYTLCPPLRKDKHICVSNSATTTTSLSNHNPNFDVCQLCLLGNLDRAMSYLDSMHDLRIPVEEDAYVALIRLCEWKRARKEGSRVYSYVSMSMTHLSLQLGNALLSMFVSVITACELLGDERLGREIHGYVLRTEFGRDPSVHNSLIQMYSSVGLIEEAETVFSRTECRDVVSWTAMISGYENSLMPQKALETYKMMEAEGIMPDEITIAIALSACSCLCHLDTGMNLHEVAKQTGLISYAIVANTLIDMYAKCKCIDKALDVFHSTHDKNIISWTSIILGLRINNRCFEAVFFFREMILRLKPNSVTLVGVLSACARIGALTCGKEIHAHTLRTGVCFDGPVKELRHAPSKKDQRFMEFFDIGKALKQTNGKEIVFLNPIYLPRNLFFAEISHNNTENAGTNIEVAMASLNLGEQVWNGVEERHYHGTPKRNSVKKQSSESAVESTETTRQEFRYVVQGGLRVND
ncbi:Pentatricopeptide repeat-containing protein [Spatholobus suberectus]|nr:Pentatricopeptide repeat-containing protein [Spatholobus suberectus]